MADVRELERAPLVVHPYSVIGSHSASWVCALVTWPPVLRDYPKVPLWEVHRFTGSVTINALVFINGAKLPVGR